MSWAIGGNNDEQNLPTAREQCDCNISWLSENFFPITNDDGDDYDDIKITTLITEGVVKEGVVAALFWRRRRRRRQLWWW